MILLIIAGIILAIYPIEALAFQTNLYDSNISLELKYPNTVVRGSEFTVASVIKNKLSTTVLQNISLTYTVQKEVFQIIDNGTIFVDDLAGYGSFGQTNRFRVPLDVSDGEYYLNVKIIYYYGGSFETFREVIQKSLPILVEEKGQIKLVVNAPQAVFPDDTFSIKTEVTNQGLSARNVTVTIIPPDGLEFRGQTRHNIGDLNQDETISLISEIRTPSTINQEYRAPFQVKISYSDEWSKC